MKVPCWRCAETETKEEKPEGVCSTCNGWGSVVPGTPPKGARNVVRAFVRSEWWKRIRLAAAAGAKKRGKKKERDRLIELQTQDLWRMLLQMPAREQREHLEHMQSTTVANNQTARPSRKVSTR